MTYQQLIEAMTPQLYQTLRRAVELGRWPDRRALSAEQREICMRAIIHYEKTHLEDDREHTGFLERPCQNSGVSAAPDIIARQNEHS